MARHVAAYECEWKATISNADRLRRFRSFVNDDGPDPSIVMVSERSQSRPAYHHEKPVPVELGRTRAGARTQPLEVLR